MSNKQYLSKITNENLERLIVCAINTKLTNRIPAEYERSWLQALQNDELEIEGYEQVKVVCSIDGKPLTDGEKALIKALRAVKIARIPEYRTSVLCFPSEDTNTVQVWCSDTPIAFLTSSLGGISKDKAIIAALKQIKAEQEAQDEAK